MKKNITILFASFLAIFMIVGFVLVDDNNRYSKTETTGSDNTSQPIIETDFSATPIYTDNFDGANDTTALKSRGYLVYRNGPGPIGTNAIWFQGNSTVFNAFNGPTTGYVASNFNSATGNNAIDNWLVLPKVSGGILVGDSLYFYSRSPLSSTFPDSIKVMYSENDSTPTGTWTLLGRFQVNVLGTWERRGFRAPTASVNGRFAIRYGCVDGGPTGNNTDYSGIDAMVIERNTVGITNTNGEVPSSYSLQQNYPNPFNPVTNIKFAIPNSSEVKLAVYDVLGNEISVLVNEFKQAGNYVADFDASKLSSGVYFYTLSTGEYKETKKMMLVK